MKLYNSGTTLQDIIAARRDDASEVDQLQRNKMNGRARDSVPTSVTAVQGDAAGDEAYDDSYLYRCVSISGTLKWKKISWTDV